MLHMTYPKDILGKSPRNPSLPGAVVDADADADADADSDAIRE